MQKAPKKKILAIDDDNLTLKALEKLLHLYRYDVTLARDGIEGMELLNSRAGFGLIITDIRMPKADGNQVAEYVRSNDKIKKTPIIGITGYPQEINRELFDSILIKPFSNEDLIGLIDNLILA
jgi:CheY-like chemotaxis protein